LALFGFGFGFGFCKTALRIRRVCGTASLLGFTSARAQLVG
jgi:hypothetical protein